MGRPTKLTDDLSGRLLAAIEAGMSYRRACAAVGIHYSTLLEWQSRGTGDGARQPYRTFAEDLEGAEARGELACVQRIRNGGPGDWRGPAWLLERRFPERWAKHRTVEHLHSTTSGPLGVATIEVHRITDPTIDAAIAGISDDKLDEVLAALDHILGVASAQIDPDAEDGDGVMPLIPLRDLKG